MGCWEDTYFCVMTIQCLDVVAQKVKNLPATRGTWVHFLDWEDPSGEGHGNRLQYSCLENPHGQRSLAGDSLWGCKRVGMTE